MHYGNSMLTQHSHEIAIYENFNVNPNFIQINEEKEQREEWNTKSASLQIREH